MNNIEHTRNPYLRREAHLPLLKASSLFSDSVSGQLLGQSICRSIGEKFITNELQDVFTLKKLQFQ